jgi:uncharacterized membrane protein
MSNHLQPSQRTAQNEEDAASMLSHSRAVLILLATGILVLLTGMMLLVTAASFSGTSSSGFGVVIFLGPIPIVIGAGPGTLWILLIAVLLSVLIGMALLFKHKKK